MKIIIKSLFIITVILFLSIVSQAKLGEAESTIQSDLVEQQFEKSEKTLASDSGPSFLVHTLTRKHSHIREYLNQDGKIFAVVWSGQVHPDLNKLLGSYYAEFHKEAKRLHVRRRGQGPEITQTPQVLVHRSGHMRSVVGKAICLSLVPKNFDLSNLK